MNRHLLDDTIKKINSDETKPLDTLIGESKSLISSQHSNTNNLINTLKVGNVPIVKSVQRGTLDNEDADLTTKTVTISNINPSKSILIALPKYFDYGGEDAMKASSRIIDGTTLEFDVNYSVGSSSSRRRHFHYEWQVIEFY